MSRKVILTTLLAITMVGCVVFLSAALLGVNEATIKEKPGNTIESVTTPSIIAHTTVTSDSTPIAVPVPATQTDHPFPESGVISPASTSNTSPLPSETISTKNTVASANNEQGVLKQLDLAGVSVAVYIPGDTNTTQKPLRLIFALHGMFMSGPAFSQNLLTFAKQNHLLIVAPTITYNVNYKDPQVITEEDVKLTAKLNQIVSELETNNHLQIRTRYLFYGFSRGAQLAHHYAEFYPTHTLGVVAVSAGAYTLPYSTYPLDIATANQSQDSQNQTALDFPYGVGDISSYVGKSFDLTAFDKISFWVEVGAKDTNPDEVSRAWDRYSGNNRVARAQSFCEALKRSGDSHVQLTVFPNTVHQLTFAMTLSALQFFARLISST